MASDATLAELLKDNTHFKRSLAKARQEYRSLTNWWMPLAWSALTAICVTWWVGNGNGGTLTEQEVFWIVLALTPTIARHFTHRIDYEWLMVWTIGMQSVIIGVQIKSIEIKIAELEQIENPNPTTLNQIEYLKAMLEDIKKATGIESAQLESVREE